MSLFGLPFWLEYLIAGVLVLALIASASVVLTKAGRHPAWCFLLLIPYVQVIAVWVFAFMVWPGVPKKTASKKKAA